MDKETHQSVITQEIENAMAALFPHGAGPASYALVQHMLDKIAHVAFRNGRAYALLSLLTVEEALEHVNARLESQDEHPISRRRLAAIIRNRHERFGLGMRLSGGQWLVRAEDIDSLMPDTKYRRGKCRHESV